MIKEKYINLQDTEFVPLKEGIDSAFWGRYEINKLGQIKSLNKKNHYKILKHSIITSSSGVDYYPVVTLYGENKKRYTVGVHILLGETFLVKEHPEDIFIDHINQNKLDFSLSNLRFISPSGNRINQTNRKNPTDKIRYIRIDFAGLETILTKQDIIRLKYKVSNINKSIRFNKTYNDYHWKVKNLEVEEYYSRFSKEELNSETWKDLSTLYTSLKPGQFLVSNLGVVILNNSIIPTLGSSNIRNYRII